jgi:hypothetical protein
VQNHLSYLPCGKLKQIETCGKNKSTGSSESRDTLWTSRPGVAGEKIMSYKDIKQSTDNEVCTNFIAFGRSTDTFITK